MTELTRCRPSINSRIPVSFSIRKIGGIGRSTSIDSMSLGFLLITPAKKALILWLYHDFLVVVEIYDLSKRKIDGISTELSIRRRLTCHGSHKIFWIGFVNSRLHHMNGGCHTTLPTCISRPSQSVPLIQPAASFGVVGVPSCHRVAIGSAEASSDCRSQLDRSRSGTSPHPLPAHPRARRWSTTRRSRHRPRRGTVMVHR